MLLVALGLGLTFLLVAGLDYSLYALLVLRSRKKTSYLERVNSLEKSISTMPCVSVVVSVYEEADVIRRKLENLAALDYPKDKLKVIVIDDDSKDGTAGLAEEALHDLGLRGKVIRNPKRVGLNASLNIAIQNVDDMLICVSDADVLLHRDSLKNSVAVLEQFEGAGGVTGRLIPMLKEGNVVTRSEETYRVYYDRAMLAESSLHSAFPGNGTLLVFNKSLVPAIPETHGSSDGNIAIGIIKNGCRFLYVPSAEIREAVPETSSQQRLQKVRRARRLIEVFLYNRDVLFNKRYGSFGLLVFPLKFLMHVLAPFFLLSGLVSLVAFALLAQNMLIYAFLGVFLFALVCVSVIPSKIKTTVVSFILHNLYLLLGLISLPRSSHLWKRVERK